MRISDWTSDVCSSDLLSKSWRRQIAIPGHGIVAIGFDRNARVVERTGLTEREIGAAAGALDQHVVETAGQHLIAATLAAIGSEALAIDTALQTVSRQRRERAAETEFRKSDPRSAERSAGQEGVRT